MSVVNRMLQDIDQRIGTTAFDARRPVPDVRSLPPRAMGWRRFPWQVGATVILVAAGALVAFGVGGLRWWASDDGAAPPRRATAPIPATVLQPLRPPAPAAAAEAARDAAASQGQPASDAPSPQALREPVESFKLSFDLSPLKARPPEATEAQRATRTAEAARPAATATTDSAPPAAVRRLAPVATASAPPVGVRPVEATRMAPASTAVRQVAAGETVASARVMWQEGLRNNAYATLREALAAAEASRDPQATRTLALELARLELAGNRAQAALDLLRRQDALLADDADALALRGNAQQRLVLHGEAAESYLAALRLRPTEGKWMLGAAISLAADGRTEEAQAWANRARDRGAITPPIAAYLQQLGVGTRP